MKTKRTQDQQCLMAAMPLAALQRIAKNDYKLKGVEQMSRTDLVEALDDANTRVLAGKRVGKRKL